jgi:murein DD-endopeptidase MepM/ murein hydrolase activator NlpD
MSTASFRGFLFALGVMLCAAPAMADTRVELTGEAIQGGIIVGTTEPGTKVILNGEPLMVSERGHFLFAFDRDHKGTAHLDVEYPDDERESLSIDVATREYDVQRIEGVASKYVSPSAEQLAQIAGDRELKRTARPTDTDHDWFAEEFIWPVKGTITGTFGLQRYFNGEPRRPHYGVDVAAPTGTPVAAPAPGIVRLAEPELYFEGGAIFLDHGHGMISVMMHLSSVDVEVGQQVAQGDIIGSVGATGRVTGPHLDWRMYWRRAHVDPALLVGDMPAPKPLERPDTPNL